VIAQRGLVTRGGPIFTWKVQNTAKAMQRYRPSSFPKPLPLHLVTRDLVMHPRFCVPAAISGTAQQFGSLGWPPQEPAFCTVSSGVLGSPEGSLERPQDPVQKNLPVMRLTIERFVFQWSQDPCDPRSEKQTTDANARWNNTGVMETGP